MTDKDKIDDIIEKEGDILEQTEIKKDSRTYKIYLISLPYKDYSVKKIEIKGDGKYVLEEEVILKNQNMEAKARYTFHNMAVKTRREI